MDEICPKCTTQGLVIVYGYPNEDDIDAAEAGLVVLGGCLLTSEDPCWQCPQCDFRWGRRPEM